MRADRRDFGILALWLVVFGLVVAPLLHRLSHEHSHRHPGSSPTSHQGVSFEHQASALWAPVALSPPVLVKLAVETPVLVERTHPTLSRRWKVAREQAP